LFWLFYAAFFSALAYSAIEDDISLAYPRVFMWSVAACYCCVIFGILAHGLHWHDRRLRGVWSKLFPVLVAVPVIGVVMDAVLPSDYNLRTGVCLGSGIPPL